MINRKVTLEESIKFTEIMYRFVTSEEATIDEIEEVLKVIEELMKKRIERKIINNIDKSEFKKNIENLLSKDILDKIKEEIKEEIENSLKNDIEDNAGVKTNKFRDEKKINTLKNRKYARLHTESYEDDFFYVKEKYILEKNGENIQKHIKKKK